MPLPSSAPCGSQSNGPCKRKCETYMETTEVSYEWIIYNFSKRPEENGICLVSSTFSAEDNPKTIWNLKLYPKGDRKEREGYLSLYLYLKSSNKAEVRVSCKFSIINAKQEKKFVYEKPGARALTNKSPRHWRCMKFIKREVLLNKASELLVDDNLIVHCEVTVFGDSINRLSKKKMLFHVPDSRLSDDLGKLREDKDSTDVILSVNGHEFNAHKIILSARSPVFAAMFKHEMKETRHSRVEIVDLDAETLKEMLVFIYTGKAPNIEEMAYPLLVAANKYGLDRLKAMCEGALSPNLSVDNASHVLILADTHDAIQLRSFVLDFVTRRSVDVMATVGWKTVEKQHPELVSEVCRAVSQLSKPLARI